MPTSPPLPRVLISILNWNGLDTTRACLASLRGLDYAGACVVVTDNASREDEVSVLRGEFPEFEFASNKANLGFAGGHNTAIRMALERGFDYVWILNNDCTVGKDDLAGLVAVAESDPKVGLVSPLIELPPLDGGEARYQFCGAWHDWQEHRSVRPMNVEEVRAREAAGHDDMWLTGTALLARCSMLKEMGGFDERYFAYYEDDELSARAVRHGYRCRMAFSVSVMHHSFPNSYDRPPHYFYFCSRNALLFWAENTPAEHRSRLRRKIAAQILVEARNLHDSGRIRQARACVAGVLHYLGGRFGPPGVDFDRCGYLDPIARFFPYRLGAMLGASLS